MVLGFLGVMAFFFFLSERKKKGGFEAPEAGGFIAIWDPQGKPTDCHWHFKPGW